MKKTHTLILISAAVIFIASGYFVMAYKESHDPPKIQILSVSLTGTGSLIDVRYQSNKPLTGPLNGSNVYLIDNATGEKLGLAGTTWFGMLISKSKENTYGYFIINNPERIVFNGSLITVVMGNYRQQMTVSDLDS